MAWNIAIVADPAYDEHAIDQLARYHPIWIVDTPSNRICADVARRAAGAIWEPDSACTTVRVEDPAARERNCLGIIDMIDLHHPNLSRLEVIGVGDSALLEAGMREFGFVPAKGGRVDSIAFRRPISSIVGAPTLILEGREWKEIGDVYTSLFEVVGAPAWHGKNFNALKDSIVTGGINRIEVPYKLTIRGTQATPIDVQDFVSQLASFVSDREAEGCPVSIQIEP